MTAPGIFAGVTVTAGVTVPAAPTVPAARCFRHNDRAHIATPVATGVQSLSSIPRRAD